MATDKQKEDGKPRKKCHRRNLQIEEFPTFTKWLGPRGRSSSHDDTSSKSYKRGVPYPPIRRIPRDSSRGGGGVVACDVPKEDGVAIGESISARGGCCCWQRSKSTQRECGLNFHFSLRKSKVVTNVSEDVAAGVSDVREEQVVEAGAVINREGCRCRCSPTFLICGRRKVSPTGVPYFPEKRSGRRNSRSTRRRCSPVVDAPNLHKEEGPATDGPGVLKEEVATSCPDLVKEGEAIAAPGPCKEGSGSCCSQWKCLPSFPMCGRKLSVVEEEATIEEEVSVDDPNGPEVEEVANGPELVKEGEATVAPALCKEGSESCSQWKCSQSIPMCERKVATGEEELTVVDIPNLLEVEVANGPELVKEGEATDAPAPCKKSGSCCSQWKCLPTFPMCGRKVATGKEELTVVDVPNLLEVEEVANGPELVKEGEATDSPGPCKKRSGSCCSQWKCLPAFPMCGRKVATGKEELTVVDVPNLLEVEEVANGPELVKEGEATDSPGPCKKRSGSCCSQWKCLPAFPMCGRKVATGKEELTVVDVPNLLEVEEVANGPELVKEGEATDSPGPCKKRSGSCCSQWKCLPAFPMCGRKVATGKEELTVDDVPNLPEVEEVANGPGLVKEGEATVAPDPCKKRSGSYCSRWKCLPAFPMCGRKGATGKEELTVVDVPNSPEVEVVANGPELVKEGEATVAPGPCKEESGNCFSQWKCLPSFPMCGRKLSVVEEEVTVDDLNVPEVANRPYLAKEGEATVGPDPRKEGSGCCSPRLKEVSELQIRSSKVAAGKQEMTVDVPNVPEVEEVANDVVNKQKKEVVGDPNTGEAVASCGSSSNRNKEEEKINASVPELHKKGSGCCWFKWMPAFLICGSKVVSDVPNPSREEKVVAGDSDIQKEGVGAAAAAAAADADANWEVQSKSARQGSCWPFQCCTIWWPSKLLCTGGMDVNASNHQEEEQEAPLGDNEEKVVDVLTVKHNEKGAAMVVPDLHEEDGTVADEQVAAVDIPVPRKEEEESAGDTPDLIQKEKKVSSGKEEEENVGSVVSDSGKEEGGCCCCLKHGGKEDGCSRRDRDRGRRQSSNSREGCWPFQICGKGWLGLPTFLICGRRKRLSDSISSDGNGVSVSDINVVVAVAGTSSVLAIAGTSGGLATIDSSKSIPMPGCGWYSKPPRRRSVSIDKEEGDSRCSKSSKRRRGWFRRSGRKEKEGKERKR
ncbi:uncharacterized protein LOC111483201 [Cucurbita maxima]|uniref:Uncharacterized protein LOC111483201 n=1 Tax=Cucurbita maxima TaxID=3661 RepID=A0A6J1JCE8_CUCMA|nr:uncharacterized protein LOC111483201 [Cucurbita maxima]